MAIRLITSFSSPNLPHCQLAVYLKEQKFKAILLVLAAHMQYNSKHKHTGVEKLSQSH